MFAAFRIVADVLVYRLRKLEMANLAAATSIGLALHLRFTDVAVRTFFALLLNVLVYLNNDYVDAELDLRSTDKDSAKTRYLNDHLGAALFAQWGLVALLVLFSVVYDVGMLAPLALGGGICVWYSAYLKRRPYFDVPSMMLWGLAMPACGFPWQSTLGWCLAVELGLFSGVFEAIQVMRDADEDAAEGVRTTGVVLGQAKTLTLTRVLMVVSTAFAALVIHPIAGVISAVSLVIPFTPDRIARYWTLVKMNYGITWLFICAWVFFSGKSSGLLWSIAGVR
jgi:4-hydroxybenzoate polyprenyltransferase